MTDDCLQPCVSKLVQIQDSSLIVLVSRLEAATSRLEDIASSATGFEQQPQVNGSPAPAPAPISHSTPQGPTQSPSPKPAVTLPPSVEVFDRLIEDEVKPWVELSDKLDPVLAKQVNTPLRSLSLNSYCW